MRARSHPLGVHRQRDGGTNIAVYAPALAAVDVLYRPPGRPWRRVPLEQRDERGVHFTWLAPDTGTAHDDDARDVVPIGYPGAGSRGAERGASALAPAPDAVSTHALPVGTHYVFVPRSRSTPDPAREQCILDPYGRGVTRLSPPSNVTRPGPDAYGGYYANEIVGGPYAWRHERPATSWRNTVLYEAHVKGLTMRHPQIPPDMRGTYAALGHPAVLRYLQELGITAIELLPVHAHLDEPHLTRNGLRNYWGYNTLGFFAPHADYATACARRAGADAVRAEFQAAVDALHGAGIQVFLDVVYNHTAEGGAHEPAYCWRALDDRGYYRHNERGDYWDVTGCGNTVNFGDPWVVRWALDSLRYWVTEYGIDGFRFDLAPALGRDRAGSFTRDHPLFVALAADPHLQDTRFIAEPWDLGPDGWQTGRFPQNWADWNDTFRDTVRDFWLGAPRTMARGGSGGTAERLASAISGSAELFAASGRSTLASVNLVTAHDGFTLHDLTAYDTKHNEANLEHNADGSNDNHSWNHGQEGPSADVNLRERRDRSARNLITTLLVSQGIPMITAGDELLRTQRGNNNAYCQDNELSWLDWTPTPASRSMFRATQRLIRWRRAFLDRQPERFPERREDVLLDWFDPDGHEMTAGTWQRDGSRAIQVTLAACGGAVAGLMAFNGTDVPVPMTLPQSAQLDSGPACATRHPGALGSYHLAFATDSGLDARAETAFYGGEVVTVPALSIALFAVR